MGNPNPHWSDTSYEAQLFKARHALETEGREALRNPHAMIGAKCGCGTCYCCAARQVLLEHDLKRLKL